MVAVLPREFYELHPATSGKNARQPVPVRASNTHSDPWNQFARRVLHQPGRIESWPDLRWTCERGPGLTDFMSSIDSLRLVSPRFRAIAEDHLTPWDDVQWLPGVVTDSDRDDHDYWLVHFPTRRDDLLDEARTTRGPGPVPIRQVLSREKVEGLSFFQTAYMHRRVYVNGFLLRALRRAKLQGFVVQRARMWRPDEGESCRTPNPTEAG